MEKKNTLLLTVIAVATLLVAVVGATFAYFGSFEPTITNTTDVNVTTGKSKTSTFVSSPALISLTVNSADMVKGASNESVPVATDTKNVSATLTTAADDTLFTICSFDVTYTSDAEAGQVKKYVPTADITGKEFTYMIGEAQAGADAKGTVKSGTITGKQETGYETIATGNPVTVISGAQVSARGGATTINFPVTVKFYNIPSVDQSKLADSTFSGKFSVVTDASKCTTSATDIPQEP